MTRKTICAARKCDEVIQKDKVFCTMHWTFLPNDIQDELVEYYTVGQLNDRRKTKKKFRVALEKARAILYLEERRFD